MSYSEQSNFMANISPINYSPAKPLATPVQTQTKAMSASVSAPKAQKPLYVNPATKPPVTAPPSYTGSSAQNAQLQAAYSRVQGGTGSATDKQNLAYAQTKGWKPGDATTTISAPSTPTTTATLETPSTTPPPVAPPTPFEQYKTDITASYATPPQVAQAKALAEQYQQQLKALSQPVDPALLQQIQDMQTQAAQQSSQFASDPTKPLVTRAGEQSFLQNQLNTAILPLQQRLAAEQANRLAQQQALQSGYQAQLGAINTDLQAQQAQQQGARDLAQMQYQQSVPTLTKLGAGESLVNPLTGQTKAQSAFKPVAVPFGASLVDPTTGQTVFNGMGTDQINSLAQSVISGQMAPSQIPGGSSGTIGLAVRNAILQQNPRFNFQTAEQQFGFGSNVSVQQQQAKIAGLTNPGGAIDQLQSLSDSISRSQYPDFNKLTLAAAEKMGDPNVANYLAQAKLVGDELGNALSASGASDLKVQLGLDLTNPNLSIGQMNAVLNGARQQLKARSEAYQSFGAPTGGMSGYSSESSDDSGFATQW